METIETVEVSVEVPLIFQPMILGTMTTRSCNLPNVYRDLSDHFFTIDEKQYLCQELRGVHNKLQLPKLTPYAVHQRYNIPSATINHWLVRHDTGRPMFLFGGRPNGVDEEETNKISKALVDARGSRAPFSVSKFRKTLLDGFKTTEFKRKRTTHAGAEYLTSKTIKKYQDKHEVCMNVVDVCIIHH